MSTTLFASMTSRGAVAQLLGLAVVALRRVSATAKRGRGHRAASAFIATVTPEPAVEASMSARAAADGAGAARSAAAGAASAPMIRSAARRAAAAARCPR